MPYIYKIVNDINDKIYVGKTLHASIEERFKEHCNDYKTRRCESRPLYSAMNKYGVEHFHIELIEECSLEEVNDKEIYWIKELNSYHNGYNATYGGDGKNYIDYDEILELWNKGYNNRQICDIMDIDTDTVKKALEIKGISKEERQRRGRDYCKKPVIMLDKDTLEELKYFSDATEAAIFLGREKKNAAVIRMACNNRKPSAYGYKWKFGSSN